MLTQLRNSAKSWIIKLLLGLIMVTFVISFGVGSINNPKEVLVEVDSHEILVSQFQREYRDAENRLGRLYRINADQIPALARQLNLRRQVMDRMVDRYLILKAARKEGWRVSDQEVETTIRKDKSFHIENRFDYAQYTQILAQGNYTPDQYEELLKNDLLEQKRLRNLVAGIVLGDKEVHQRYRLENQRVEVDYFRVNPEKFQPPGEIGDVEIKAYHKKNPKLFTEKPRFRVRFFVLGLSHLEKGLKVRKRAVTRYFERNKDTEFSTPKQVRISQIMMRMTKGGDQNTSKDGAPKDDAAKGGAAKDGAAKDSAAKDDAGNIKEKAREEAIRAKMDKVLARARAGEDFAGLARKFSEDLTGKKGGDLGFFNKDDMLPWFSEVAFSLAKNGISNVVQSPSGLHILKVTDVKPGKKQTLAEVRGKIEDFIRAKRAENKLKLEVERTPSKIQTEGFDKVAASLQLQPADSEEFGPGGVVKGLGSINRLYNQIRKARKGDTGVLRRNPVLGHVFYEVTEKKNAYVKPLKTVRSQVAEILRKKGRRKAALSMAKSTVKSMKNAAAFSAFAGKHSFPIKTVSFTVVDNSIAGLGVNPDFLRSAFKLTAEKPFALNIKDEQAYLMRFKRRFFQRPKREAEIKKRIRRQLEDTYRQYVIDTETKRLRSKAKIDLLIPELVEINPLPPLANSRRRN